MKRGLILISLVFLLIIISFVSAEIRFQKDGDNSIEAIVDLKESGTVNFNVLYSNASGSLMGIGKAVDERLAVSEITVMEKDSSGNVVDNSFTVGSYLLKALVSQETSNARNVTTIQSYDGSAWIDVCVDKIQGDTCEIGDVDLIINKINYIPGGLESVTFISNILTFFEKDSSRNNFHKYFIASYGFGIDSESYLLRADINQDQMAGRNVTTLQKLTRDSDPNNLVDYRWINMCHGKTKGNMCSIGNIDLILNDMHYYLLAGNFERSVTIFGGSNVNFNTVYDVEGNYFTLPLKSELPTKKYTFEIFNSSGTNIYNWVAYIDADGNANVKRDLPPFDSVDVIYASSFTTSPVNVNPDNWLTQLATKADGSIGDINVMYGIIDLIKDTTVYREKFISLSNSENESIKVEFLSYNGEIFYTYFDDDGDPVTPSIITDVETRDLLTSGKILDGTKLIEDYSEPVEAVSLFNYFTPDYVLQDISLYSQSGTIGAIDGTGFPRPDTDYWQADMSTLVQVGELIV